MNAAASARNENYLHLARSQPTAARIQRRAGSTGRAPPLYLFNHCTMFTSYGTVHFGVACNTELFCERMIVLVGPVSPVGRRRRR